MKKQKRSSSFERLIDFYLGIPLLLFIGMIRKVFIKTKKISHFEKIGIYKEVGIGDLILVSAATKLIKASSPSSKLILFCSNSNVFVAHQIPGIDKIIIVNPKNPLKIIKSFRKEKLDLMLDLGAWPRINAFCVAFSKAKVTLGFKTKTQYRHYAYDYAIEHNENLHEYRNYLNLASTFFKKSGDFLPELKVTLTQPSLDVISSNRYVIFHLRSGGFYGEYKEWPIENWVKLTNHLISKNLNILITGSKQDYDYNQSLINKVNDTKLINIAGKFNHINDLASIIYYSETIITIDTGILHLASVIGAKVIALHGPTSPTRWGGVGPCVYPVTSKRKECGFLNLGFDFKNKPLDCMESISVNSVMDVFNETQPHFK